MERGQATEIIWPIQNHTHNCMEIIASMIQINDCPKINPLGHSAAQTQYYPLDVAFPGRAVGSAQAWRC
jgi:hypothetical protein